MIQTQLSIFDAVVLGIMFLSCLFAFFRGFVREVLSLGAWIGAGLVTLYYFPTVSHKLEPQFKNPIAAAGIATIGLYMLALIGFSIFNRMIIKFVKSGSDVGLLDNLLGLVFGGLRGAFIVALAYLMVVFAIGENAKPEWMRGAITLPYVIEAANALKKAAPDYLHEITSLEKRTTDRINTDGTATENTSYSHETTRSLDHLIEGTKENKDDE